jgi:hypothetical protein
MSVSQGTAARESRPGCGDERRLRKTKTPGVFKRIDGKGRAIGYVCVFRAGGRQRKRHARTYEEAKRIKRESETDRDRGELQERTAITLRAYLDEWVERYRGQGSRRFRENTRDEYRHLIGAFAHPYFPARLKLIDVSPYALARFVDWLADEKAQVRRFGDRTIANATMPLRAALATAKREGLIRHNPAQGLSLPPREQVIGEEIKVFTPEQLARVIRLAPDRHRLLLEILAATGLRISEAIALQRLHVQMDGPRPRSASAARSSTAAPSRRRPSTAAARSASRPPSRRSSTTTSPPSPIRTPPRSSSPTTPAPRSTPATPLLGPQAGLQASRRALGGLPHLPPHFRLPPPRPRHEPPPAKPRPRPPLTRLHADALHASAAG